MRQHSIVHLRNVAYWAAGKCFNTIILASKLELYDTFWEVGGPGSDDFFPDACTEFQI